MKFPASILSIFLFFLVFISSQLNTRHGVIERILPVLRIYWFNRPYYILK